MLALKRLPEKHTLIKLAAQTNKRTQILIQTGRGKRQGGTNNDTCSASASGNTVLINLHYMYSLYIVSFLPTAFSVDVAELCDCRMFN